MAVCSRCGREAAPYQHYCQYCGEALDTPRESAPAAVKVATAVAYGRIIVRSSSASGESSVGGEEREYVLDGRDVAVGRSPSCDIPLSGDQLASRRHALLRFKNGRYTIVDLGSSNGTYVNDDEIREETELRDGDCIKIGGHEILFSTAPASPHASLAGMRMSQPLPHIPLSETNPSMGAIALSQVQASDAPAVSNGDVQSAQPQSSGEAGEVGEAGDAEEAGESGEPAEGALDAFAVGTDEEQVIALNGASPEQEPEVAPAAEAAASEQEPDTSAGDELETLRMQLGEISTALARRAEENARTAERLRATLAEVRDQLHAAIGTPLGDAQPSSSSEESSSQATSDLITVARQAAENPRHLDYVTRLAERAGDIADALEARPATEPDATLRTTVEGLIARLDQLLA